VLLIEIEANFAVVRILSLPRKAYLPELEEGKQGDCGQRGEEVRRKTSHREKCKQMR
jgi:hypothetical protein